MVKLTANGKSWTSTKIKLKAFWNKTYSLLYIFYFPSPIYLIRSSNIHTKYQSYDSRTYEFAVFKKIIYMCRYVDTIFFFIGNY